MSSKFLVVWRVGGLFSLCVCSRLWEKMAKRCTKFLQFDTDVNIMCENKNGKALALSIVCFSEFMSLQNHAFIADSDGSFTIVHEHR